MTTPFDHQIEELLREYRKQRDAIAEMRRQIQETTVTVTAPKQAVKVTVGAQGEVQAIEFPTTAFRRMPQKELADILLTTIQQARVKALEKTGEVVSARLPAGVTMTDLLQGKADPTDILPAEPVLPDEVRDYVDHGHPVEAEDTGR